MTRCDWSLDWHWPLELGRRLDFEARLGQNGFNSILFLNPESVFYCK